MTRIERERLVEQYLEGSMDFAQEENFFIQVALDDELRRTLKSYRIVEEAIRKEREAGSREHAAARYVVAGMLAATPQPAQAAGAKAGGAAMKFLKRGLTRRIASAGATVGLVAFGWMAVQQFNEAEKPADNIGIEADAPATQQTIAPPETTQEANNAPASAAVAGDNDAATRAAASERTAAPSWENALHRGAAPGGARQQTAAQRNESVRQADISATRQRQPAAQNAPSTTPPQLQYNFDSAKGSQTPNTVVFPTEVIDWKQK